MADAAVCTEIPKCLQTTNIALLDTKIQTLETEHKAIEKRLWGNGRPGEMETIYTELKDIKKSLNKVIVYVAALSALGGGGAGALLRGLF